VTTLRQIALAQGGTRGDVVLALRDGRVLLSQSHQVDVIIPITPPTVVGTNPPSGAIAALPLGVISVIFDQDMLAGDAADPASVVNPDNYVLIGLSGVRTVVRQVTYDAAARTALLQVAALLPGTYTLTVNNTLKNAIGVPMRSAYSTSFTALSDFSALV